MKIQELECKTGLERATIRFYEREGLINPKRNAENGYREYSESDAALLLKIRLLRQLEFPMEKIKAMQKGELPFASAMEAQIHVLEQRTETLERAGEVCRQISADGVDFGSLDAAAYLRLLNEPTAKTPFREEQEIVFHPVRRYLARTMDWALVMLLLNWLVYSVIRVRPEKTFFNFLIAAAGVGLTILVEAVLLRFWGTTPGKWICGIRVESVNGGRLSWEDALWRARLAMHYGMGFHIRIWQWIRFYLSYTRAKEGRRLEWEEDSELLYGKWNGFRIAGTAFAYSVILLCLLGVSLDAQFLPKHREVQLTVEQFAKNFNGYAGYAGVGDLVTFGWISSMDEDGTWYGFFMDLDGSVRKDPVFTCDDAGYIKTVTLEGTWSYNPVAWINLLTTAAGSRPEMGIWEMVKFSVNHPFGQEITRYTSRDAEKTEGEFSVADLNVFWEYEPVTENLSVTIAFP